MVNAALRVDDYASIVVLGSPVHNDRALLRYAFAAKAVYHRLNLGRSYVGTHFDIGLQNLVGHRNVLLGVEHRLDLAGMQGRDSLLIGHLVEDLAPRAPYSDLPRRDFDLWIVDDVVVDVVVRDYVSYSVLPLIRVPTLGLCLHPGFLLALKGDVLHHDVVIGVFIQLLAAVEVLRVRVFGLLIVVEV